MISVWNYNEINIGISISSFEQNDKKSSFYFAIDCILLEPFSSN